jgi:hypothetical protein
MTPLSKWRRAALAPPPAVLPVASSCTAARALPYSGIAVFTHTQPWEPARPGLGPFCTRAWWQQR